MATVGVKGLVNTVINGASNRVWMRVKKQTKQQERLQTVDRRQSKVTGKYEMICEQRETQQQVISERNVTKQDTLYTTNTSYSLFTGSTQLNSTKMGSSRT